MKVACFNILVGLLAIMLVMVPPGGAVCWPLFDGWHLHIGWSDAAGRPTPGLVVYTHRGPERVANPHRAGFSALVAPDSVNLSDLRPLLAASLWLLPLLTLCWLCLARDPWRRQPEPLPLEHPPDAGRGWLIESGNRWRYGLRADGLRADAVGADVVGARHKRPPYERALAACPRWPLANSLANRISQVH